MAEPSPDNFIPAVWRHWQAIVTGGIVAVAGLLWAQFGSPGSIPAWAFWVIALACLLVACWRAWLDKHRELQQERKRHNPNLEGRILESIFSETAAGDGIVFVFVEIRNIGEMQSIADNWRVLVSPPAGADLVGSLEL